jgi:glucose/arabinose dehydrogenase
MSYNQRRATVRQSTEEPVICAQVSAVTSPDVQKPTGFVKENGDAMGRPVGVAIDKRGALLVADDVGNTIWRVTDSTTVSQTRSERSIRPVEK